MKQVKANGVAVGIIAITVLTGAAITGCATTELLNDSPRTTTKSTVQKATLVTDEVVAFGKPSTPLANVPADSVVIVGNKNSYVITQGGYQFTQLLGSLDPNYIQVTKDLEFYSPKNDGHFEGNLNIAYTKLKSSFGQADYDMVLRNKGQECSTASDLRMNAQRFCFSLPLQGGVYPAVSNLTLIQSKFKPLSHPYQVSIYTNTNQAVTSNGGNAASKLVLLPFALAFDVITLPLQILSSVD